MLMTDYDWKYFTERDGVTGQALKDSSMYWPRGKMLGGSSNINGMIYIRGNTEDYQNWYDMGNEDWHPNIVNKYFKKAESIQDQKLLQDPLIRKFYGNDGPLAINKFNSSFTETLEKVLSAYEEIGINKVNDLNVANVMGSGFIPATASNGKRGSTDHNYLNPVRRYNRNNLYVITDSLVSKILINATTKAAEGIEVERNGIRINLYANLEVIVSAGAINTPQLLMLSGVGPKKHLESKNISCIVDSPAVGQNLQDHLKIPLMIYSNNTYYLNEENEIIKYIHNQTGHLGDNYLSDILAFYSLSKHATYPDFQVHLINFPINFSNTPDIFQSMFGFSSEVVKSIAEQNKSKMLYAFFVSLLHPHSLGKITLRSSNPRDHPLIYYNYYSDSRDLNKTVEGLKMLANLVNTKYFKSIDGEIGKLGWTPCDKLVKGSDDYWKCLSLSMSTTTYHPVGTARMGSNIESSVVSSKLNVHGVKKLRVVDASVMPSITSGNTNAPTIMIAERAADIVKDEYTYVYF
ncbi:unnamed protein product [Diatraea saccharalis]|uniref:Glucose-methanol-choline oxidoreductase N-terminal domain-containing protein n=1 Tax=Diatraea saccharalis TaxID=40085 RepID=A0A9N9QYT1_9NEOP|nr:unnamed protein product [Diatraea saccharalis]